MKSFQICKIYSQYFVITFLQITRERHVRTRYELCSKSDQSCCAVCSIVPCCTAIYRDSTVFFSNLLHYSDVIMGTMASQITSLAILYSTVYSGAHKKTHQSSASLAFVRGIHRWLVNSPHKSPFTRKKIDDVTMYIAYKAVYYGDISGFEKFPPFTMVFWSVCDSSFIDCWNKCTKGFHFLVVILIIHRSCERRIDMLCNSSI